MRASLLLIVLATIATLATLASVATPASAHGYPAKPIRLVVPYPAGGVADVVARLLSARMAKSMGQPIVVENRPGAAGTIGAAVAAQATPDGYTLLLMSSSLTVAPSMYTNLTWDPLRSFAAVALVGAIPSVIVVHPSVPSTSLKEFVAYAKARPGVLNFGSAGAGSIIHLAMEMLQQRAGIQLIHIPYKGQPEALIGLLTGDNQVMALTSALAKPPIEAGQIRALAVTSKVRSTALPNVPTVVESGFPDYEETTWFGFATPAGTSPAIIARLNSEIVTAMKDPNIEGTLRALGAELSPGSPQEFQSFLDADVKRWSSVIKQAGIKGK